MKILLILAASVPCLLNAQTPPELSRLASGNVQVRNNKYGDLLRPRDASNKDGAPIVLYSAQPWKCMTWKMAAHGESSFVLENVLTSKTLAPDAGRGNEAIAVVQVPLSQDASLRPAWKFTLLPGGVYQISEPVSGKCLTASTDPAGSVRTSVSACQGRDEQKWEVLKAPDKLTM